MSYTSEHVLAFCEQNDIACTEETAQKFDILFQMLSDFNAHTNVTALKTESDICSRHFLDSLYPLKYGLLPQNAKIIDIGCGAGFPGLPLKMLRPDLAISFVDSTEKNCGSPRAFRKNFRLMRTYSLPVPRNLLQKDTEKNTTLLFPVRLLRFRFCASCACRLSKSVVRLSLIRA